MYVWTKKDIAEVLGRSPSTPYNWVKVWGPDSHHPFPEPVARVQTRTDNRAKWSQRQDAYDPVEIRDWVANLRAAKALRMSESHRLPHKRNRTVAGMPVVATQEAVADMHNALKALRDDLKTLKASLR